MTMKIRIVGAIDEHLMCYCGHEWEDHHHGCVMNPEYFDHPLCIQGLMAQECEYNQRYGQFIPQHDEKEMCKCPNFKPRAHTAINAVKAWRKKQDERRKNGRQ